MLSRFREQSGRSALIIAAIALIVALGGTALAKSVFTKPQEKKISQIAKNEANKYANSHPGAEGKEGKQGSAGTNGAAGQSVALSAAGSCANGGTKLTVGAESKEVCNGTNGANATFEYLFNTATSGDPTSKHLGLDNATPSSAAHLRISETNNEGASGTNIAAAIARWVSGPGAVGTLMVRKVSTQSTYAEYSIIKNEDKGTYDELEVKFVAGSGVFANTDPVTIQYYAAASETLSPGKTETGTWSVNAPRTEREEKFFGAIPFTIPVVEPEGGPVSHLLNKTETAAHAGTGGCTGTIAAPTAPPGVLCVYTLEEKRSTFVNVGLAGLGGPSWSKPGALVVAQLEGEPGEPAEFFATGSYAITAPNP